MSTQENQEEKDSPEESPAMSTEENEGRDSTSVTKEQVENDSPEKASAEKHEEKAAAPAGSADAAPTIMTAKSKKKLKRKTRKSGKAGKLRGKVAHLSAMLGPIKLCVNLSCFVSAACHT